MNIINKITFGKFAFFLTLIFTFYVSKIFYNSYYSPDIEKYIIRHHIDSMGLATDYKKDTERYNFASTEIKRRLIHQLKKAPSSRRLYRKKTRKKYLKKNIDKEIDRMPIKKAQKLYFEILENHKPSKSSKK